MQENIDEKIDKRMSFSNRVKELVDAWKKTGKIGEDPIETKEEAIKKAVAISYSIAREK